MEKISLIHGEGGYYTNKLIKDLFYSEFNNDILMKDKDAAQIFLEENEIAYTTDSFVVKPLFFNGGDIGRLCVCGTVNDLVTAFSIPKYLSLSFIIEEGFLIEDLKSIVSSIKNTAEEAKIKIVTGDTKVVEKGKVDGIFINTSGIGVIHNKLKDLVRIGDDIIVTSTIGEHGSAIALSRYALEVEGNIKSDVTPLNDLVDILKDYNGVIKVIKDPTRGGLAQGINEIADKYNVEITIMEDNIPIRREVRALNKMIGIDPLYLACEGVMIIIVDSQYSESMIKKLHSYSKYENSEVIGKVTSLGSNVVLKNNFGGKRILRQLESIMLPRIC